MVTRYVPPTPRERIQARQNARAWQLQRDLDALDEARAEVLRAAAVHGIYPHRDPADPWAENELRPCEPRCEQHARSA